MNFKKLIYACLMGGFIFMLFGCNPRSSRAYLEKRIGTEMSRVYPTNRLEDLFEQFPDGFKIKQSFKDGAYIIHVELVATSKDNPINGTISKVENKSREKTLKRTFSIKMGSINSQMKQMQHIGRTEVSYLRN